MADTKVEFGFAGGELLLIDEVGTPDSSRFWPLDGYEPGGAQPSFDKQFVRDWLDASGWDREPPPPNLPADVIDKTAAKYREAYERVTGEPWPAYLARMCRGNLERTGSGKGSRHEVHVRGAGDAEGRARRSGRQGGGSLAARHGVDERHRTCTSDVTSDSTSRRPNEDEARAQVEEIAQAVCCPTP